MVERIVLRDFRGYGNADIALGPNVTVVHGANGAGKTNLLEALYFSCTGRSCRTANERELVRFDAASCRTEAHVLGADGPHVIAVGFAPGEPKRLTVDGAPVERLSDAPQRPLVSVFLPDRLELVKGAPGLRRAHLDQVVAALWPARAATRRAYARALAQRNALLVRIRTRAAAPESLRAWDAEVARHGIQLRDDRAQALAPVAVEFAALAADLGLAGACALRYRPRTQAPDAATFMGELAARRASDVERGFSQHGPHRDDFLLLRDGRELRSYGSQGEQRLALLALLLAERRVLAERRAAPPLLLLDDVMSELDARRRARLVDVIDGGGQTVISTTDVQHVPGAQRGETLKLAVAAGVVLAEVVAA